MTLFGGCGGITSGFRANGKFEPCAALESRGDAASTYQANFGDHVFRNLSDIVSVHFDVVVGGLPPTRADEEHAIVAEVWKAWTWAVHARRPSAFVFVLSDKATLSSPDYAVFWDRARREGYNLDVQALNAADFGVPLVRRYLFLMGSRRCEIERLVRTHLPRMAPGNGRVWRTVRVGAAAFPATREGRDLRTLRPVQTITSSQTEGGRARNRLRTFYGGIREGFGDYGHTSTADGLRLDRSCGVPVTLRDVARCLTIPDDFIFPADQSSGSITDQLAMTVPPVLAECVAEALARSLHFSRDAFTRAA